MLICPNCNTEKMEKRFGDYHFTECGLDDVYLKDWTLYKCGNCAAEMPLLPDPDDFTAWLAEQLVRQESRLNGNEIFFLRKALGLTGAQLAERLGVQRVEVSRWENNRQPISFHADFQLRMEVAERLLTPEHVAEVTQALRHYTKDLREAAITIESVVHRELVREAAVA
jgi:putative zinc finger/helix-turn-helix YgiT family protein